MTVFATAMRTLATDPNGSVAGNYAPHTGAPFPLRGSMSLMDPTIATFGAGSRHRGWKCDFDKAEKPTIPEDDEQWTTAAGDWPGTYKIRDAEDVPNAWRVTLNPA